MSKAATRGTLIRDFELTVISRGLDLLATLPPDRRQFVANYWLARLDDLPVVEEATDDVEEEPPMMPRLRGAASALT